MNNLCKNYLACLMVFALMGCSGYTKFSEESRSMAKQTTTPRDILSAKIVNRLEGSNHPFLTVGKFVELADRYQSCQCTNERFVRRWEKTADGYLLHSYFNKSSPIEFICTREGDNADCFILEIDRGKTIRVLNERFAAGSSLVKFIYEKGVKCEQIRPCK